MATLAGVTRLPALATGCASVAALLLCGGTACGPTHPTTGSPLTSPSPTVSSGEGATPSATSNPLTLAQNDCIAPPPRHGNQVHSVKLGATVTLPAGWAENPADEGKHGLETTLALETGVQPNAANISADPFPSSMTPHDAVTLEISEPGAGTMVARGDCMIATSPAAFFESTIEASLVPGVTWVGDGYSLYIAHDGALVRMLIDLPSDNGISTPLPRASVISDVKSILGSWQWDRP